MSAQLERIALVCFSSHALHFYCYSTWLPPSHHRCSSSRYSSSIFAGHWNTILLKFRSTPHQSSRNRSHPTRLISLHTHVAVARYFIRSSLHIVVVSVAPWPPEQLDRILTLVHRISSRMGLFDSLGSLVHVNVCLPRARALAAEISLFLSCHANSLDATLLKTPIHRISLPIHRTAPILVPFDNLCLLLSGAAFAFASPLSLVALF